MRPSIPRRRPEILDSVSLRPAEARRALDGLGRVNRWTLGFRAALCSLIPRMDRDGNSLIVDLGTGTGELLHRIGKICARRNLRVRTIGLDRKLDHLAHGRRLGFLSTAVVADVTALPFRDSSCDWTLATLLLHHFDPAAAERVLAEMVRVGRRGAIVTDLRRATATSLAARLLPLLGVGSIAAADGRSSAEQAWQLDEIAQLADKHHILELKRRFPCRLSLVLAAR